MKPFCPLPPRFFRPPEPVRTDSRSGWRFQIWAPEAAAVSVAGDFQGWRTDRNVLTRTQDGLWEGFVPNAQAGDLYKYVLHDDHGAVRYCADPTAAAVEPLPGTAGRLWDSSGYRWQDAPWLAFRQQANAAARPTLLCPLDLTQQPPDGYRTLVPTLKRLGYTGGVLSLGLGRRTAFFAPCAGWRPEELMGWVDAFHQAGLSVLLDWNATDFSEPYGTFLATEDCPNQFDWRVPALRRFLLDCAQFWLRTYHLDGLRVAVDDPRFFFPGRDATGFLTQLADAVRQVCPAGQLAFRTPFPLDTVPGWAERSAQPLADLFLRKTWECPDEWTGNGLLAYPDFRDPACYLAYLALPGGKLSGRDVLSQPALQQSHRCYLTHPTLWPDSPFRWAHRPTEALPVLAFWRGTPETGEILCLCNPTETAFPLSLHTTQTLRLLDRSSADRDSAFSAVPERLTDGESVLIPPRTCLLFDHTPDRPSWDGAGQAEIEVNR